MVELCLLFVHSLEISGLSPITFWGVRTELNRVSKYDRRRFQILLFDNN
jgi:hypothetical protein